MATTFHYITFLDGGLNQEVTLRFNQNGPLVKHLKTKFNAKQKNLDIIIHCEISIIMVFWMEP